MLDPIDTARLRLRVLEPGDALHFVQLITPEVSRWLASWPSPVTERMALDRIADMRALTLNGGGLCLAIERRDDGVFIGCVMIVRARHDAARGDLGYWLGEPYHRHGYMKEAAAAAIAEAFTRLDVKAIEAGAQPANAGSLAVMRALGMRAIGTRQVWASARQREELCEYYEIRR